MQPAHLAVVEDLEHRFGNKEDLSAIAAHDKQEAISCLHFPNRHVGWVFKHGGLFAKCSSPALTLSIKCFSSSSERKAGL